MKMGRKNLQDWRSPGELEVHFLSMREFGGSFQFFHSALIFPGLGHVRMEYDISTTPQLIFTSFRAAECPRGPIVHLPGNSVILTSVNGVLRSYFPNFCSEYSHNLLKTLMYQWFHGADIGFFM